MRGLNDKNVIVTGGASGIGRAICVRLAEEGANVGVFDINLHGPVNMCRVVLPAMVERGAGRVVSLSSDAGRVGSSGEAVYAACKGGIIAFTNSVARELARKGVVLNVVSPGPTDTPMYKETQSDANPRMSEALIRAIPMKRLGRPEDHAGMVSLLCSDEASYITGQVISISGGLTMAG